MGDPLDRLVELLAGRYEIEREIGRGGMASVFLARDLKHARQVAIKLFSPDVANAVGAERFLREIEIAARLTHPHVLPLHDSGGVDDVLYYVMPYVAGESLRERLRRETQLPLDFALGITRQVARALEYAHGQGVVHRDIKPDNVLLIGDDAVVADFGIARAIVASGGETLTNTGLVIGTPNYMAPEQAAGTGAVDARSDLYALACILYEMVSGRAPLTGPDVRATMARRLVETPPPLRNVRPSVTPALDALVARALAPAPADRFDSVADFRKALEREHTSPSFAGVDLGTTSPSPARSRRRLGIGAGLAVVAVVVVAAVVRLGGSREDIAGDALLPERSGPDPNRIAVTYLADLTPEGGLAHLAAGLTEGLIDELSAVAGLDVISPNGVRPFRDEEVGADSVGRALNAGTIVAGSVAESGEQLRVTVRLIDAASNRQLDAATLTQERADLFAIQDTLTVQVARLLRQRLGEEIRMRDLRSGASSARAWELVQLAAEEARAAETLADGGDLAAATRSHERADSILARAAELDPRWVQPPLIRARLAYQESRWIATQDPERTLGLVERSVGLADRALGIAPGNADALEVRGTARYWSWLLNLVPDRADELFAAAEADLRAAVAADPRQAGAWSTLSHLVTNKPESTNEAQMAARRAYEADAYLAAADQVLARLFLASYDLGDFPEARRWCDEGFDRFPEVWRFTDCRLWLLSIPAAEPDVDAAWALVDAFDTMVPPQITVLRNRARMAVSAAAARAGLGDSARAVAERARAGREIDPTRDLSYMEAFTHVILGDADEALRLLTEYVAANREDGGEALGHWWFDPIEAEPRFRTLAGGPSS